MEKNMVLVYTSVQVYEAELLRQMLADHQIHVFLLNKQDSAYKIGDIELYVQRDDTIRAKRLIEEFHKQ